MVFFDYYKNSYMKYDLSILICTLPNRTAQMHSLFSSLYHQSIGYSVEILYLGDNKSMSVGAKRNGLMSISSGKYLTFIDDDDSVSSDYIASIIEATKHNPEVICFQVDKLFNGQKDRIQKFSKSYGRNHRSPDKLFNLMLPNHLCVWRRDVVKELFPDINLSEDYKWAEAMNQHYNNEHHIDKILYTYNFSKEKTETQVR